MPGMPGMSGMPDMHGMPGMSGMPDMHGMPGMPGMHGMDGIRFPSVAGSRRFKKEKSEFPYMQDEELETQRSRLANLKNQQPLSVKRRRPASQRPGIGQPRKPSKVILQPIRSRSPNELDQKLMDDLLRKAPAATSSPNTPFIDTEKDNGTKELKKMNNWKIRLKGDKEIIFTKERKTGIAGKFPMKPRSLSTGGHPLVKLPSSLANLPKPVPHNRLLPNVLNPPVDKQLSDKVSIKKSLSDSKITTPRFQPLTPLMTRSVSIASLVGNPSLPQSPTPSIMSTLPLLSSSITLVHFAPTPELKETDTSKVPPIRAPTPKLSFTRTYSPNGDLEIDTARHDSSIRSVSVTKLRQIEEAAQMLKSSDLELILKGTSIMHQHLLVEKDPPIDAYLDLQVVKPLARCLSKSKDSLVLGALLALSGVVCGNHEQTCKVVDAKILPDIIRLLNSENEEIVDQCIICLGNIAGGSEDYDFKEDMLEEGVITSLAKLIENNPKVERAQKLAWVLSNLSQPNYLPINDSDMDKIMNSLLKLLEIKDQNTNQTAMWVLSYITERAGNQISEVIDKGFVPIVFNKISEVSEYPSMLFPMLRVMGNIASGDNSQTQSVIDNGLIPFLVKHCSHYILKIRKECLWIISNITAGVESQIQATIDNGVFPTLASIVQKESDLEVLKEAGWGIANVFSGGSTEQVDCAVVHNFPKCLVKILFRTVYGKPEECQMITLCLEALKECLNKCSSFEQFCKSIFDETSLDDFEIFIHHENETTVTVAKELIEAIETAKESMQSLTAAS